MKSIDVVEANQLDLDAQLSAIDEEQRTLNQTLNSMEDEVKHYFDQTKLQPVPNQERFSTYNLADNINKQLEEMSQDIKEMITKLNTSYDRTVDDSTDTNNIIKILNSHLASLQWVDHKSAVLSQQIHKAEVELKRLQ